MSFLQSVEPSNEQESSSCTEPESSSSPKPSKLGAITSAIINFPRQLFSDTAASGAAVASPPPATPPRSVVLSVPPPLSSSSLPSSSSVHAEGSTRTASSHSLDGESFARQCQDVMERAQHLLRCREEHARLVAAVQDASNTMSIHTNMPPHTDITCDAATDAIQTTMHTPEPTRPSRRRSRSSNSTASRAPTTPSPTRRASPTTCTSAKAAAADGSSSLPRRRPVRLSEETPSPLQCPPAPHPTPVHPALWMANNEEGVSPLPLMSHTDDTRTHHVAVTKEHAPTRGARGAHAAHPVGSAAAPTEEEGNANALPNELQRPSASSASPNKDAAEEGGVTTPGRRTWRDVLRSLSPRRRRIDSGVADAASAAGEEHHRLNESTPKRASSNHEREESMTGSTADEQQQQRQEGEEESQNTRQEESSTVSTSTSTATSAACPSSGSSVTRRIRQLYDTLRQLTPCRAGSSSGRRGDGAGAAMDSPAPSQLTPAEEAHSGTPGTAHHSVRKSVQFASADKLESVTPTKIPSSSSSSSSVALFTDAEKASANVTPAEASTAAQEESVSQTTSASRRRQRRAGAAVTAAAPPPSPTPTEKQQKKKPVSKAAKKEAGQSASGKPTSSAEHQEMLRLVRSLSVRKSLERFSRSELQRFLHAEGVLCHSPARTKRALLSEVRALAGLR